MEEAFDALKKFIGEKLPERLAELSGKDTPLPPPSKIVFGVVDVSRTDGKNVCAIIPGKTEEEEPTLTAGVTSNTLTVGFIHRGADYQTLLRQMVRTARAFRVAVRSDWTLGGLVDRVELGGTEFYPDAGPTSGSCCISETEITVQVPEANAPELDPFD
ncbi:MAG: hypothetical protein IJL80_10350 [Treponema sp.]|nr:hypothetical protein [Treponema sp.]